MFPTFAILDNVCFSAVDSMLHILPLHQSMCVCVLVIQSCLNLCDPMDCNAPGSSVLEYVKAVYFTLLFTYMQSTSWETLGWMKHKLESRLSGEISITSDMQMTSTLGRKPKTKEPPNESERGEWKSWLKNQHSENLDLGIWSHHFMANRWGNSGNSGWLYFLGLQNHCRWWLQPWN